MNPVSFGVVKWRTREPNRFIRRLGASSCEDSVRLASRKGLRQDVLLRLSDASSGSASRTWTRNARRNEVGFGRLRRPGRRLRVRRSDGSLGATRRRPGVLLARHPGACRHAIESTFVHLGNIRRWPSRQKKGSGLMKVAVAADASALADREEGTASEPSSGDVAYVQPAACVYSCSEACGWVPVPKYAT